MVRIGGGELVRRSLRWYKKETSSFSGFIVYFDSFSPRLSQICVN